MKLHEKIRYSFIIQFLIRTPEETLENRKKRNRDTAIDSPFVARVLRIEQKKINDGLDRADIIQDMHGRIYTE